MTDAEQPAEFSFLEHATLTATASESLSELVDQLVDGHGTEADPAQQLILRADALASLANRVQAVVLATFGDAARELSSDALTVLLHDRCAETIEFESWESNIPLFLLATSFAPYTSSPAPQGTAIVWLNPHTERSFLESLAAAGVADLMTLDPNIGGN